MRQLIADFADGSIIADTFIQRMEQIARPAEAKNE